MAIDANEFPVLRHELELLNDPPEALSNFKFESEVSAVPNLDLDSSFREVRNLAVTSLQMVVNSSWFRMQKTKDLVGSAFDTNFRRALELLWDDTKCFLTAVHNQKSLRIVLFVSLVIRFKDNFVG